MRLTLRKKYCTRFLCIIEHNSVTYVEIYIMVMVELSNNDSKKEDLVFLIDYPWLILSSMHSRLRLMVYTEEKEVTGFIHPSGINIGAGHPTISRFFLVFCLVNA